MSHAKLQFRRVKMDWWEQYNIFIISSGKYLDNLNDILRAIPWVAATQGIAAI